jgi:uncharacterized surface protein with fasciclin (FAS1) repeats
MRLKAMAAAIALALGAATALAQQQPSSQQPRPGSQQPSSQQPSSQRQGGSAEPRSLQQPSSSQPRSGEPAQVPEASRESSRSEQSSSSRDADHFGAQSQGAETFDKLSAEHTDLATFSKAVKTAGLADSLTAGTQYTVFAPTDEAWESKSGKNAGELMEPANREELVSLLRAHIVADDVDQELASRISKAKTIDGGEVDIQAENGELMVGNAKAVDADSIEMDNLRIYPIDGVLAANASASSALGDTSSDSNRDAGSRSTQESTREPRGTAVTPDSSRTTTQTPGSNPATPPSSDRSPR